MNQVHDRYDHPGNVLLPDSGAFAFLSILRILSNFVSDHARREVAGEAQLESPTKRKHPIKVNCEGTSNENGDFRVVKASLSWVAGGMMNISDLVDLPFSVTRLTDWPISPLYREFIKTNVEICFINTGYFPRLRNPYFSIGLDRFDPIVMTLNEMEWNHFATFNTNL
jgi:Zn-dependent M16 (insulinase) family peptidase